MPKISLVVCLRNETPLLKRLLQKADGCFDDLVVVHDGADEIVSSAKALRRTGNFSYAKTMSLIVPGSPPQEIALDYAKIKRRSPGASAYYLVSGKSEGRDLYALVKEYGGRLYFGPRCYQQEPHWPFAWSVARYNWILRLDADEYPSKPMKAWLYNFRRCASSRSNICGYTSHWPLWDGLREVFVSRIASRPFLINKLRTRFIGMAEQEPIPFTHWNPTALILRHRPRRKSFGIRNILFRKQALCWRQCIASSLLLSPQQLPRWNYFSSNWPLGWDQIIKRPWWTGLKRFLRFFVSAFLAPERKGFHLNWSEVLMVPLHQLLMAWTYGFNKKYVEYKLLPFITKKTHKAR